MFCEDGAATTANIISGYFLRLRLVYREVCKPVSFFMNCYFFLIRFKVKLVLEVA